MCIASSMLCKVSNLPKQIAIILIESQRSFQILLYVILLFVCVCGCLLSGSAWGDWANYTESPLRAFESELGVQAPLGYFDPMGLSKDGDVETFRRRRECELKNGRVAMFATMGYMVPEYFKFPGYLAPSANLKFADVPNGLAAITKVPAEGWLQWVALCGCYEFCVNTPVDPADPGNYGKGKLGYGNMVLGISAEPMQDAEARKRALNSELANGRLAMMAIVGLWVQEMGRLWY